ncbi:MAG: flagellar hook-basal body protein [Lachnospiraceae bacterium]|nr:flagellar hook-basal body protein [Lachnospiraceae bacterium]
MLKGLYTAYTGMINEQHRMDVMTNNLANADTNGFKKEGTTSQAFDTVLAYKIKDLSEPGNLPKNLGTAKTFDEDSVDNPDRWVSRTGMNLGVKIGENYVDYSEGPIKETGNTFDLAISDRGFFAVEYTNKAGETSTKYTRDGNFTMDRQGYLVTQDGDFVLDENGRHIKMNTALPVSIDRGGTITQEGTSVATIGLTDFEDYDYLERFGENYFQTVDGATEIDSEAQIYSGYLELSNISIVTEMVNMITLQRQYESNQKLITTYDETLDTAVNQLGKL